MQHLNDSNLLEPHGLVDLHIHMIIFYGDFPLNIAVISLWYQNWPKTLPPPSATAKMWSACHALPSDGSCIRFSSLWSKFRTIGKYRYLHSKWSKIWELSKLTIIHPFVPGLVCAIYRTFIFWMSEWLIRDKAGILHTSNQCTTLSHLF